jgi:transposase InsO family protein
MSRAASPSRNKPYGLAGVCRVWETPRSTVYAHRAQERNADGPSGLRPGPEGPCSDQELVEKIREVLRESPFHGEGHRKVWARLRFAGVLTSKRRVLRLMRDNNLLAPHRVGNAHGPKAHDGSITTDAPDLMWGTDLTTTVTTGEGLAHVFVAVDHCAAECVGIHAAKSGNRFEALEPVHQGVREHFGAIGKGVAGGLVLRHDHGPSYMSHEFQEQISFLGMESSPAFVREPEGNGCAERFIRTLKENLLWVRHFETIEELRKALLEFKELYNTSWLIERHGYKTPAQVRKDLRAGQIGRAHV